MMANLTRVMLSTNMLYHTHSICTIQYRGAVMISKSGVSNSHGTSYVRHDAVIAYKMAHAMTTELLPTSSSTT